MNCFQKTHHSSLRTHNSGAKNLATGMAYNLNRLVAKKYIERIGGGRSIRYKVTGVPLGRIN